MSNTLKECALQYASMGWAVFPLLSKDKRPATKNGCKDATTDRDIVEQWWNHNPAYNIGIATGQQSGGLVVIDLDIHEEAGISGYESLKTWQRENGMLPDTAMSITGRGGYHIFYKTREHIKNRVGIYDGVDIRGDGGYIVAPPSVHPNGQQYEWEQSPEEKGITIADRTVLAFMHPNATNCEQQGFELPEQIPQGERTNYLVKMVCSMQSKGASDGAIRAAVQAENQSKCIPPLTDQELEKEVFPALKRYEKGTSPYIAVSDGGKSRAMKNHSLELTSMDDIQELTPEWLVADYIPRYQITTLAGDGGSGKTTIWCNIAAAVSSGKRCFMEEAIPEDFRKTEPGIVLFFSSEDSFEYTLKGRLKRSGAILSNIKSISLKDERFADIKFDSPFLERLIEHYRPELVIFDPIQSFVPKDIQMGQRNAMRSCLNPLIGLGEKYGTTFIVVVHANKQTGVYGRKRIADSADIWDISRSVLMVGDTPEKGVRYISHEKSNYGMTGSTVLFSIENGAITHKGYTDKKDREYVSENYMVTQQQPQREEAKEFILDFLKDGEKEVSEMEEMAKAIGISAASLKRAKQELKKSGQMKAFSKGFNPKVWYAVLIPSENLS